MNLKNPLRIPEGPFSAYLFDLDGTIVDSMPVHLKAWRSALSEWGCDFPEDLFYSLGGTPTVKIVEILNLKNGLSMPPHEVTELKEKRFFDLHHEVEPVTEVLEVIHSMYGKLPFAVVSGSPRDTIIKTLTNLEVLDRFQAILGAEDYPKGKPNPDCFLLAARQLKAKPQNCLVFEDADLGIQAAEAAGMKWVKVDTRK